MPITRDQGLLSKQRPAGPHPRAGSVSQNMTEDIAADAKDAQGPEGYENDAISKYAKGGGVKRGGFIKTGEKVSSGDDVITAAPGRAPLGSPSNPYESYEGDDGTPPVVAHAKGGAVGKKTKSGWRKYGW